MDEIGSSRRAFLASLLAAGAGAACGRSSPMAEAFGSAEPAAFPEAVALYREDFKNWCGELRFPNLRSCAPRTAEDVVDLANWAAANGFALRARGMMHGWSPLALDTGTDGATPVLLADTTQYLNQMALADLPLPAVRVQCGATMDDLTAFLERAGYGFTSMPTTGNITIGGALAVNAHGAAVPAGGERKSEGQTFGSLSNRVLALTAVVWEPAQRRYVLRSFRRTDPEAGALLTNLGRSFLVEVTLLVEPDPGLHCVSHTDIPYDELFAAPGSGGRTLASLLDASGRVEVLWFAFTRDPWVQTWTLAPAPPSGARVVGAPYNYPFIHNFPDLVVDLATQCVTGNPAAALLVGKASLDVVRAGLLATSGRSLWGHSRNLLLWVKPDTLREHRSSWAVITRRDQVQRVVNAFVTKFVQKRDEYRAQGRYPVNMPVEVRVCGLDDPADAGLAGAQAAHLSAAAPVPGRPDWDTAVWIAFSTVPGTPDRHAFARQMEQWAFAHFSGADARIRPEWARGWAYSDSGAWSDPQILRESIPQAFGASWPAATQMLQALDGRGIYENGFLRAFTG